MGSAAIAAAAAAAAAAASAQTILLNDLMSPRHSTHGHTAGAHSFSAREDELIEGGMSVEEARAVVLKEREAERREYIRRVEQIQQDKENRRQSDYMQAWIKWKDRPWWRFYEREPKLEAFKSLTSW
jgi:hypothetical protein